MRGGGRAQYALRLRWHGIGLQHAEPPRVRWSLHEPGYGVSPAGIMEIVPAAGIEPVDRVVEEDPSRTRAPFQQHSMHEREAQGADLAGVHCRGCGAQGDPGGSLRARCPGSWSS